MNNLQLKRLNNARVYLKHAHISALNRRGAGTADLIDFAIAQLSDLENESYIRRIVKTVEKKIGDIKV